MTPVLEPRMVTAANAGPFTLDGTNTFLVGRRQVAIIDPGPDVQEHIRALSSSVAQAWEVSVLLTHSHSDHAGAAASLAEAVGARVFASSLLRRKAFIPEDVTFLRDGDLFPTDQGDLKVLAVPGHSRDHLAFHWLQARALFVGDLVLGRGVTTWVGEYPGCVADYLDSLEKVAGLDPAILYPAHGPAVFDPQKTVGRFRRHRLDRIEEVRGVRADRPDADAAEIAEVIHGGELPEKVRKAATESVEVILFHLEEGMAG